MSHNQGLENKTTNQIKFSCSREQMGPVNTEND